MKSNKMMNEQYDMIGHVLPIATQHSNLMQFLCTHHKHLEKIYWIPGVFNGGYFASNKY